MAQPGNIKAATRFCLKCDYALDGLSEHRCPECGTTFEPHDPSTYRPFPLDRERRSRDRWRAAAAGGLLIVLLLAITILVPEAFSSPLWAWLIYALLTFAVLVGFAFQKIQRDTVKLEKLRCGMSWEALIRFHERRPTTWNPLLWLLLRFQVPGALELEFAYDLFVMGHLERALKVISRGIERARRNSRTVGLGRHLRANILMAMGRYDDARADIDWAMNEPAFRTRAQVDAGRLALMLGRLEAALGHFNEAMAAGESASDDARISACTTYWLMGRFDESLAVLESDLMDGSQLYDEKTRRLLMKSATGRARLESTRRQYAAALLPLRAQQQARVYLTRNEIDKAVASLTLADQWLTWEFSNISSRHDQLGYRGLCAAMRGDADVADRFVSQLRLISAPLHASTIKSNSLIIAGRVAMILGRHVEAIDLINRYHERVPHPIDRHQASYWIALAAKAAGQHDVARDHFDRVIADGFDTWMARETGKERAALASAGVA